MTTTASPIQTRYGGCHFRSRLEARWAVFFNTMQIPWIYEPEGYELSFRRYLPDFLLPECGTFIEVRGDTERVDLGELVLIAGELPSTYIKPESKHERGPRLMLLGPLTNTLLAGDGELGWLATSGPDEGEWDRCGFDNYHKNHRPWWLSTELSLDHPLNPTFDRWEPSEDSRLAYMAALSARFEHGQSGAT
jgi:hypothetical protein